MCYQKNPYFLANALFGFKVEVERSRTGVVTAGFLGCQKNNLIRFNFPITGTRRVASWIRMLDYYRVAEVSPIIGCVGEDAI